MNEKIKTWKCIDCGTEITITYEEDEGLYYDCPECDAHYDYYDLLDKIQELKFAYDYLEKR